MYQLLGALLTLLPLYLFRNSHGIKRYVIILATLFSVIQCIDWINISLEDKVIGIDGAFNIITNFSGLLVVVVALWAVAVALHFLLPSLNMEDSSLKILKWPVYLWAGAGHAERYSSCIRTIRCFKHNIAAMAIWFGVVCYLAQASVNLNLPIATPLVWTLLALGGMLRNVQEGDK